MSIANVKSNFVSPVYNVKKIPVWDIVGQSVNPNTLTGKAFSALTQSIFNQGYAMSITVQNNPIYVEGSDPTSSDLTKEKVKSKLKLVIEGGENDAKSAGGEYATEVSDEKIREMFKIQIVDGSQRSAVIRMGTKHFLEDENIDFKVERWAKGENIPEKPGEEMLKYIAWREDFSIPCAVLAGKSDAELMSATILMNTARGSHSLDSMKDIVYNLINVAGMSEEWVSQNLYLDIESVKRMQQLSGLKAAMSDIDDCDMAWNPTADQSYQRKMTAYLVREATNYIELYRKEHTDFIMPSSGTAVDIALEIGFDKTPIWEQHGELYLQLS